MGVVEYGSPGGSLADLAAKYRIRRPPGRVLGTRHRRGAAPATEGLPNLIDLILRAAR